MQEAITNATKHASGAEVFVTITWGLGRVQLDVTNPSPVTVHPTSLPHHRSGSGHGLIGMRERAVSAGGTFVSGETYDGGYFVTVTLMCESPYEAPHAAGAKEFGAA
jgi:signal transduction histidine kinase